MMKKTIIGLITCTLAVGICLLCFNNNTVDATDGIIEISTPEELDAIRYNLGGNYQLVKDIDMTGYYTFEPIGNELDGAFTGSFDGNGYTIKNLELNYGSYKYVGLFGYLDGPVQNVNLENIEVQAARYGGGIAGYGDENGSISNCNVSGSISVSNDYFDVYAGGIAGYSSALIKYCNNNAEIKSDGLGGNAYTFCGGIVGTSEADIFECNNSAKVDASTYYATNRAAGICPESSKDISNCKNSGYICCDSNYEGDQAYGIGCGDYIFNSINTGEVTSWANWGCNYGIGRAVKIENCVNKGNIRGYGIGIADFIIYCYNVGDVRTHGIGEGKITKSYTVGEVESNGDFYHPLGEQCLDVTIYSSYVRSTAKGAYVYSKYDGLVLPTGEFNVATTSKTLYEIKQSNSYTDLDFEDAWKVDENWNSGFPIPKNIPTHLELNEIVLVLYPGETFRLKGRVDGIEVSDITWESADSSIVSVSDNGLVKAESEENANTYIVARTSDGLRMNCTVFVYDGKPSSVSIDNEPTRMRKGQSMQLETTILGAMATRETGITWTSSDENVISVTEDGVITAKAFGSATITATTENGKSNSCTINVNYAESISIPYSEVTIGKGKNVSIAPTVYPEGAVDTFTYSSSDTSVATVAYGTITAKTAGTCTITVTSSGGLTQECKVTVTNMTLSSAITVNINKTKQLPITLTPTDVEQQITCISSNEEIVTVDNEGNITGISAGTANVTVTSDSGITATCKVTVTCLANTLELERAAITMEKGTTDLISVILDPIDATDTITYTSSNTSVVAVSTTGVLTARAVGTSQITVKTSGGLTEYCSVAVTPTTILATDIELSSNKLELYPEEKAVLTATITPSNATNNKMTWASSDETVATVNQGGTVTAVRPGEALITVSLSNGLSYTCDVTVKSYSATIISVDNTTTVQQGNTIHVNLNIVNNPGFSALNLAFAYDTRYFTLIAVENKMSSMVMTSGTSYVWDSVDDYLENGEIAALIFEVNENAPIGEYGIEVQFLGASNSDLDNVEMSVAGGTLKVTSLIYGDANGDGLITTIDLTMIRKYLADLDPISGISSIEVQNGADVNGDGSIGTIDLAMIRKYLASIDPITGESSVVLGPR